MKQARQKPSFLTLFAISIAAFLVTPSQGKNLGQNLAQAPVSLHFSEIEVSELLQLLAKMGKTNFLLSESIQGKIGRAHV